MQVLKPFLRLHLYSLIIALLFLLQGCALFTAVPERIIEDDFYTIRYPDITREEIYIQDREDSILLYLFRETAVAEINERIIADTIILPLEMPDDEYLEVSFIKSGFDLDLLSFLFKYRSPQEDMARQLNSELSGVVFAGFRRDIYTIDYVPALPGTRRQEISHTGFSFGIFSGFGSTYMSPWVTSGATESEYDGVVWIKGIAALLATPNINIALGVGFDYLLDGNRNHWIYQHKPWLGFAVGIDLN